MSTKSYSIDLRSRVINHVEAGNSQREVSKVFKISKTTVGRWWLIFCNEQRVEAKRRGGSKGRVDKDAISQYVQNNPNKTLVDIGKQFSLSANGAHKHLKKLGFSYKKKLYVLGSE